MTALSTGTLKDALSRIGHDAERRQRFIDFVKSIEPTLAAPGVNVREEVTGPLVDALFGPGEVIRRKLASGLVMSFPYRSKIARDFVMADDALPDHVWEPQTTKLLLTLAAGAKHVIIGGAYFGDQAIPLAQVLQASGGTCHCFDINPEQLRVLAENATQNRLENVVINAYGLWDRDNRRVALVGDDSHAYSKEAAEGDEGAFPTISIDSYAKKHGFDRVEMIMLDIEGAELAALRGAERHLRQPAATAPNVIFEVHRSYVDWSNGLDKAEIVVYLAGLGYQVFAVRDYQGNVKMTGQPVELVPVDDVYLDGPPHGFNMLAVKDPTILERNGMQVVPGVSPKLLFHRDPKWHHPRS